VWGTGVYGGRTNGIGVYGTSISNEGVYGVSSAAGSRGVYGINGSGTGVGGMSSTGAGVEGQSSGGYGVLGTSSSNDGVHATNTSSGNYGSLGTPSNGVYGSSSSGYGVFGISSSGYAGYFMGQAHVTGTLYKGGGAFKIDHPLDPERQYLYHSFVESPDMMNIYNGNATTDSSGEATVELPAWFEALNRDFRYQLTAIGVPGPNLYVAEEITGGRFKIAGGKPDAKVSWQVTGIRKDPFANTHRIPVEEEKPAIEQGSYLHPDAYGQPEEKSVEWARNPDMMRQMKEERAALEQQNPTK
jgi:hypothetical protein